MPTSPSLSMPNSTPKPVSEVGASTRRRPSGARGLEAAVPPVVARHTAGGATLALSEQVRSLQTVGQHPPSSQVALVPSTEEPAPSRGLC